MYRQDFSQEMFKSFRLHFPRLSESAYEYYQDGPHTLVVRCKNGKAYWFDELNHSIRVLPNSSEDLDKDEFAIEFSKRVGKMLEARSMSQSDLAEKMNLGRSQLSRYLNGRSMPSFYMADRIAKALNCSLDELRYHD